MKTKSPIKVIAGMPAYNEQRYVGSIVLQTRQYVDEVVVVDDGSLDKTSEVAEMAGAVVVRHEKNSGYGSAIQSIFSEAKRRNADILIILDADSQHNPDEIPSLIKTVTEGSDVVIGSREMQENIIAPYRRLGQKFLARMTSVASRQKLSDTESGFRAYSRKAIETMRLKEKGMAISSEIVSEASSQGLKITEVPISVIYTKDGSTLNPWKHGLGVLQRILVMISERRPLFFFGLFGNLLIVGGIVAGIIVATTVFQTQVLMVGTALISMLLITIGILSIFTGILLNVLTRRMGSQSQ